MGLPFLVQLAQDSYEWRDAGDTRNKITFAQVFDCAPRVVDNQLIACAKHTYLFCYTIVVIIAFYGKLQIWFFIQAGEGKWAKLFCPAFFVYDHIGSLAWSETVSGWFFQPDTMHIVR